MSTGPGVAAAVRRRSIGFPLLCAVASLAFAHVGLGVGLLISGVLRPDEFFTLTAVIGIFLFIAPGLMVMALAGDGLRRQYRRRGEPLSRARYLLCGLAITGLATCLGVTPLRYWPSAIFVAAAGAIVLIGSVALRYRSQPR